MFLLMDLRISFLSLTHSLTESVSDTAFDFSATMTTMTTMTIMTTMTTMTTARTNHGFLVLFALVAKQLCV